jgi:hypothetical protein
LVSVYHVQTKIIIMWKFMNVLLQKIRISLFGPRSGSSMSSAAPESFHRPKPQPVGSSIEIDEPKLPEPDMDGWIRLPNGDRYRKIKCGMGSGSAIDDDDPSLRRRRRVRVRNNPFIP